MTGRTGIIALGAALCALVLWFCCGRNAAAEAVYPVQNGTRWFARHVTDRVAALFARADLAVENEKLKRETASLRLTCGEMDGLAAENARLRTLLGLGPDADALRFSTNRWMCAEVLSRGGASGVPGTLRIGRGSLAGIRPGAVVAAPEGLVGRVSAVSPHTADVRLITDPQMRVAGEIETGDPSMPRLRGILSGGGLHVTAEAGASFLYLVNPLRVRNVERRTELPARAKIITSGLGGVFPRGLVVGFLMDGMRGDETNLEREGDVEPAVTFSDLDFVFIRRER